MMLNPKRLAEIGYGSVRQSEEEGRDMARTILTLLGRREFKSEGDREEFENFMAQRFGDSIDQRRCLNGDGTDYMSWDMAVARTVWMHLSSAPPKPVISKEKLCDWLEDNFDIDDSQRAAFAACFAHCCDCIVQSDSTTPVGEIVAWAGTDREKGITREVDFRFLRFDVLPGTKLYAVRPAPAILTDALTAIRVGGSPTELIEALTAIKPKFGAPGSRDVDVRAANFAIDKAIEKLSNL